MLSRRVRVALVGIFAILAVVITVGELRSQPGRPGGITGIPGRPGGITGMPGRPGGVSGMPTPGGFTPGQSVWVCEKCGAEAGRGLVAPLFCPKCGVRFTNGGTPITACVSTLYRVIAAQCF